VEVCSVFGPLSEELAKKKKYLNFSIAFCHRKKSITLNVYTGMQNCAQQLVGF
jgi:hypothetical protein